MTKEEIFDDIVKRRLEAIEETLTVKAKEYRRNGDPYHNFRVAGGMLGSTPEKALLGMMAKHSVSIMDMINDLDKGVVPSAKTVNEKIGDAVIYHILLEGLLKEVSTLMIRSRIIHAELKNLTKT